MKTTNGFMLFGFFRGMVYKHCDEEFEKYKEFRNSISKNAVIKHIESLDDAITSIHAKDIFTGEDLGNAGLYDDGPFRFPIDFLHYYKNHDIGIPDEYERYLMEEIGLE